MQIDPKEQDYRNIYKLMVGAIVPRPIAFVSSQDRQGNRNLAPFSYFTACSANPPCIVFSVTGRGGEAAPKDTLRNIQETGEFVVNIVSEEFAAKMNTTSGEFPPEVDEFRISGLTPAASRCVKPPRVKESHVQMECRLVQTLEVGEKAGGGTLVIGEVVMFHVDDAVLTGGTQDPFKIDPAKLRAVGRMGGPTYTRTRDRFDMARPSFPTGTAPGANAVWTPTQADIERTNVWRFMQRLGIRDREEFLRFSTEHIQDFHAELERELGIEWDTPYSAVLDTSYGEAWARWFTGGRLNVARNCLDRHAASGRIACIWRNEAGARREITFAALADDANRLARYLSDVGVAAGDRVALCVPMDPELLTVLYACFKIGAIAVPIFSGFGASAISSRLADSGARILFTARTMRRHGKEIALRATVDQALTRPHSVERVIELNEIAALTKDYSAENATIAQASGAPLLLLYTSGTTGKPKGCVHTHAGALLQAAKEIYLGFDHQPGDRFFWLSDIGWMMGPWMILGNHHFGGTIMLYDGAPDFPDADQLWRMLEEERITTFGVSPTAVRMLMRSSHPENYRMSALRLLGSTGEPWDEASWMWFFEQVGRRRCPIINISGGTEIIGSFLFPLPIQPLTPCTLGGPAPGMATEVVDEQGRPARGKKGYLVCTKAAPSMTAGLWNDPDRYIETYWSRFRGWWYHGDWASVDADGHWYLHGRADESMNVAGRKVGPGEVEEILCRHAAVSEAAVIGVPDALKGEAIVAFVVTRAEVSPEELSVHVANEMGAAFRPKAVHIVPELPKTESGKIVRRLIRRQYLGEELGDTSTVANLAALAEFQLPV